MTPTPALTLALYSLVITENTSRGNVVVRLVSGDFLCLKESLTECSAYWKAILLRGFREQHEWLIDLRGYEPQYGLEAVLKHLHGLDIGISPPPIPALLYWTDIHVAADYFGPIKTLQALVTERFVAAIRQVDLKAWLSPCCMEQSEVLDLLAETADFVYTWTPDRELRVPLISKLARYWIATNRELDLDALFESQEEFVSEVRAHADKIIRVTYEAVMMRKRQAEKFKKRLLFRE